MEGQLLSPQKKVSVGDGSLHRKCGNYWHLRHMADVWPVTIKPQDKKRAGRNLENTAWQDLAAHTMPEGAAICPKCVRYLPETEGYGPLLAMGVGGRDCLEHGGGGGHGS